MRALKTEPPPVCVWRAGGGGGVSAYYLSLISHLSITVWIRTQPKPRHTHDGRMPEAGHRQGNVVVLRRRQKDKGEEEKGDKGEKKIKLGAYAIAKLGGNSHL